MRAARSLRFSPSEENVTRLRGSCQTLPGLPRARLLSTFFSFNNKAWVPRQVLTHARAARAAASHDLSWWPLAWPGRQSNGRLASLTPGRGARKFMPCRLNNLTSDKVLKCLRTLKHCRGPR